MSPADAFVLGLNGGLQSVATLAWWMAVGVSVIIGFALWVSCR